MNSILTSKWTKVAVFVSCLVPLGILVREGFTSGLGANPVEALEHGFGDWTLRFLLVTLSITPLRKLLQVPSLIKFRRMMGLFAFFYGCAHFTTYLWLDKFFNLHEILLDVAKRKYITVGFTGFVLLIPLALTSTAGWIRRLGGKRWLALHRLIYAAAIAGVIHYLWLVKADIRKPLQYAFVLSLLLGYRLVVWALPRINSRKVAALPARSAEVSES